MVDQYYNTNQAYQDYRSGYVKNGNASVSSKSGSLVRGFIGGNVYVGNGNYSVSTRSLISSCNIGGSVIICNGNYNVSTRSLITTNGSNIYASVNAVNGNCSVSTNSLICGRNIGGGVHVWNGNYVSTRPITINDSIYESVNTVNGNYSVSTRNLICSSNIGGGVYIRSGNCNISTRPITISGSNIYRSVNTVNGNCNNPSGNFSSVTNNGGSVYSVNGSGDSVLPTNLIKNSNIGGNVYVMKGNYNVVQNTNFSSSTYSEEESEENLENKRSRRLGYNFLRESHNMEEPAPDIYMMDPSCQKMQGDEELDVTKLNSGIINEDSRLHSCKYAWEISNVKKESVPDGVNVFVHGQGMQEDEKRVPRKLNPGWFREDTRLHIWKRSWEINNEKKEPVSDDVNAYAHGLGMQDEKRVPRKLNPGWSHEDTRLHSWKRSWESNNVRKEPVSDDVKADAQLSAMQEDEKRVPRKLNPGWIHEDTRLHSWKYARENNEEKKLVSDTAKEDPSCQEVQENEEEIPAKKRRQEE